MMQLASFKDVRLVPVGKIVKKKNSLKEYVFV